LNARYPNLDFQYADPEPNFDRSKVLGVAAKLFTVKDPKFLVALDAVAGGNVNKPLID
jgi:structural maintenance of chromosome 2